MVFDCRCRQGVSEAPAHALKSGIQEFTHIIRGWGQSFKFRHSLKQSGITSVQSLVVGGA